MWRRIKSYLALGIALATCPCHLPLVWLLVLAWMAGTVVGEWLAYHSWLVHTVSGIVFVGGLAATGAGLLEPSKECCDVEH